LRSCPCWFLCSNKQAHQVQSEYYSSDIVFFSFLDTFGNTAKAKA
jgi:hypothetical protein